MIKNFKKFISNFIKISFVKDVSILQVERAAYIILGAANSIILARILGPESYGLYGLMFAFVGLINILMGWGGYSATLTILTQAYTQKDKKEVLNILSYFMIITLLATAAVGIAAVILAPILTQMLYHNSQVGAWSRLILISGFVAMIHDLLTSVLQSIREIKKLAALEVGNKFAYVVLPIAFVLLGWQLSGIAWGYLIAAVIFLVVSAVMYSRTAKTNNLLPGLKQIFLNINHLKIKKYFTFSFLIAVNKNLGSVIALLPVIFLGMFATPQEVGFFKIASAYVSIPTIFLSPISRILDVQLPKSKIYGPEILKKHFLKTALYSGLITLILIIPFIVLAPFLVKIFYGPKYTPSIKLIYYLALTVVVSGYALGLGAFYRTVNKMTIAIALNVFQIVLMVLIILIWLNFSTPLMAIIWSLTISAIITLPVNFWAAIKILKKTDNKLIINDD